MSVEGKIEVVACAQARPGPGLNVSVQTVDEYGDSDAEITLSSKKYGIKKTVPVKIMVNEK